MSDTFSSQDIEEIIRDNQDMSSENQEYFDVDKRILESIFDRINSCDNVQDIKRRIVKRAAYILSLITNLQPFHEHNRRTAYSTAMDFLRRNNLNLPLNTLAEEKEVFDLLDKTKKKMKDDSTLCVEIEHYLAVRVVDYYHRWRF